MTKLWVVLALLATAANAGDSNTSASSKECCGPCRIREDKERGTLLLFSPARPALPLLPTVRNEKELEKEWEEGGTEHSNRDDYTLDLGEGRHLVLGWGSMGGGRMHEYARLEASRRSYTLLFESSRADARLLIETAGGRSAIGIVLPRADDESQAIEPWHLTVGGRDLDLNDLRARASFPLLPGPCDFYNYKPPFFLGLDQLFGDRALYRALWFDIAGNKFVLRRPSKRGSDVELEDDGRAALFYMKACDAGVAQDCNALGFLYESGRGVAKDEAKAAQLYEKACDGGSAKGCSNLAHVQRR
jgi:hypothetical protein